MAKAISGASFLCRAFAIATTATALSACSFADRYADRATTYNSEATDTRTDTILLNIVRAAYRKPLQFSEVSTVTGTASVSGMLASSVPFVGGGGTISPQVSASGGPTFAVANLNTQEFYSGLQKSISTATIGNLLQLGYDPQILFSLVIGDIEVKRPGSQSLVSGDIDDRYKYLSHQDVVTRLVYEGLSVEKVATPKQIGPTLNGAEAKLLMRELVKANASADAAPASLVADRRGYRLERSSDEFRFCFDPLRAAKQRGASISLFSNIYVAARSSKSIDLAKGNGKPIPGFEVSIPAKYRCGAKGTDKATVDLNIKPRSLQSIYYFLGSMARLELGLNGPPQDLGIGRAPDIYYLFNVRRGLVASAAPTARLDVDEFHVDVDPSGQRDASSQVLQLLSDLQALQSKAKDLPQPTSVAILAR